MQSTNTVSTLHSRVAFPFVQAAKAYEKHVEKNGKPDNHEKAKEIMAGFAGAFIDRMVETKGVSTGSLTNDAYC